MENHDAAISFMSILWNKAGHSAGFKTLYTSQIASDTSDIEERGEKCFKTRENSFLGWAGFFFCTAPSTWQPFNFHVHKCSCSMAPFGNWLSAGQIMIKLGHTHTVTAAFCCLTHSAKFRGPERGLKMPLWVLLIFKRVEWLLTSPDAVKSPWPHTKTLHCYCWQYCWHTVLKLDNDFFSCGGKKSWKKLLDSELI